MTFLFNVRSPLDKHLYNRQYAIANFPHISLVFHQYKLIISIAIHFYLKKLPSLILSSRSATHRYKIRDKSPYG